jgi:hypothetical protein
LPVFQFAGDACHCVLLCAFGRHVAVGWVLGLGIKRTPAKTPGDTGTCEQLSLRYQMRDFARQLREAGHRVHYLAIDYPADRQAHPANIDDYRQLAKMDVAARHAVHALQGQADGLRRRLDRLC